MSTYRDHGRRRWLLYSIFSGTGVLIYGDDETSILEGIKAHARAYRGHRRPGDGDRFRLVEITELGPPRDYTYHEARPERVKLA